VQIEQCVSYGLFVVIIGFLTWLLVARYFKRLENNIEERISGEIKTILFFMT
jgi:hypothetical protein